jgi:acid phosphatase (class A)
LAGAAAAVLSLASNVAAVQAQAPASAAPNMAQAPRPEGYLTKSEMPDTIEILPPPPAMGSLAEKYDEETFAKTRALAGGARYALAARDAVQYFQEFECPLGLKLADWPKPVTTLLARVARDASTVTNLPKDHFARPRPFIAPNGPICTESDRAGLMKSFSYPSGHATFSWTMALILAEMVPDRATDILARSRAFGESRVVCGVHTVSDITEARTNASALVAVLHSKSAFRADVEAAGAALRAAIASAHTAPDAGQCKIEANAEAHTPWVNPTSEK